MRLDLTQFTPARTFLRNRWPQFLLRAINLAGFVFTILACLFGSVVGSHNFVIGQSNSAPINIQPGESIETREVRLLLHALVRPKPLAHARDD